MNQERLLEIERRQNRDRNRIDDLASTVAELRQLFNKLANGLGQGQGGGASGGAWADAAAVTAGGSADLVVHEVRTSGDVDVGERTVHNRYDEDTDAAGGPLILVKNPDDSYLILGQGCPPGGG